MTTAAQNSKQILAQNGTAGTPSVSFLGGNTSGMYLAGTNQLGFCTAGVNAVTIDSSGNVGIGTSSPGYKLDVYSATSSTFTLQGDSTVSGLSYRASADTSAPTLTLRKARGSVASPAAVSSGDTSGSLVYSVYGGTNTRNVAAIRASVETYTSDTDISGYLWFQTASAGGTTLTERMRIDSSGNVGIGTASPGYKLDVASASDNVARFSVGNKVIDSTGNVQIFTTNAQSTDVGGSLALGGKNGGAGAFDPWAFGVIKGAKENSTSGNFAGYLAFAISSSGGTISERMRIDSSGNVGIGTSSPASLLNISTTSNNGNPTFRISGGTGTGANVGQIDFYSNAGTAVVSSIKTTRDGSDSGGAVAFYTAASGTNSERMRIDSSGNVGIGTSTFNGVKTVVQGTQTGGAPQTSGTTQTYGVLRLTGTTFTAAMDFGTNGGNYGWIQYTDKANLATNYDLALQPNGGNLLVGTTAAYSPLTVNGSNRFDTATFGDITTAANNCGVYLRSTGAAGISWASGGYLAFFGGGVGTTERARIDTSGNLLVGTTSILYGSGQNGLSVKTTGGYAVTTQPGTNNYNALTCLNAAGTIVGSVYSTASATSYITSSDYRLKNSVAPMTTGLATVAALKPVTYKWNVDDSDGEGFIAHELQEVIPHAVTGEKDVVDADGKPIHQGVDYSKIVVHLVAAIQELSAKNDALEARLATLEGK